MSDDLLGLQADCLTSSLTPDAILDDLESGTLAPGDITISERRRCIFYLWTHDLPLNHKAHLFGISVPMVYKDLRWLKSRLADQMGELDVKALAGEHMAHGLSTAARLAKQGELLASWTVRRQLITDMQSLGLVTRAADRIELQVNGYEGRTDAQLIEERESIDAIWEKVPEGEQDDGTT